MVYLKYNTFDGEGDVNFTDDFREWYPLMRMDLLQDWIGILTKEYEKALDEFHRGEV